MITAINKKNQKLVNKAINWLIKYSDSNDLRDRADDNGDEKMYKKFDRVCENSFNKYLEIVSELPKREVTNIEKSIYY
jgi:uncharacterized radical SAM superfamily Fe-S cluster-containing enzyme